MVENDGDGLAQRKALQLNYSKLQMQAKVHRILNTRSDMGLQNIGLMGCYGQQL